MKTIVYQGPKQMVVEEERIPQPEENEALIKVEAVGICGSELEGYLGHSSVRVPPLVMGHEFCGIVSHLPENTEKLSIGQKVIVNPLISCAKCDQCLMGKPNICRHRKIIGIHQPGAFAEYVAVPLSSINPVPDDLNPDLASLAEPLAVSIHGLKLGMNTFEDVVIFGAGPIGLLTLQAAFNMGAGNVLVVDRKPERLAYAEQLGAKVARPEQLNEKFIRLYSANGVDTILDCVGVEATREHSLQIINPGGTVVMVGLGHDQSTLSINHLVRQEVKMVGSYTYTNADFEQAVRLIVNGKIHMDHWATIATLSEGPASFKMLAEGKSKYSKIILKPD